MYVGLALTSHDSANLVPATFDNVTVPGWPLLPGAPGSLTAAAGNAQVTLSWPAVSGASSYNLKSATNNGGSYTVLTNVTTTSYTNTGLLNGMTYFYVVSALNIAGESTNSAPVSAMPQVPPTLMISQTGTDFMFSWPVTSAGFTLQSSTNLAPGSWVTVTSAVPQIINGQWQVILPSSAERGLDVLSFSEVNERFMKHETTRGITRFNAALYAGYPGPDITRLADDFYMVSRTFINSGNKK